MNERRFDGFLARFGRRLSRVPSRWRPAAAALLALVSAVGVGLCARGTYETAPTTYQASALTADFRDVELRVDPVRGTGRITREVGGAPDDDEASEEQAPIMDWNNQDVRDGAVMRWCLQEGDVAAQQILRDVLGELGRVFPRNVRWEETCPGSYSLGPTAQLDCPMPTGEAVACAVYYGARAGRVSYNGNYRAGRAPGLSDAGMRVALAHEAQHLILNLGHNDCGVILDPRTRQPVASVMTPLYLPDGPSCSQPPARGLEPADWPLAVAYYNLNTPTPTVTPTPRPTATPTPRATPTAAPLPFTRDNALNALATLYYERLRAGGPGDAQRAEGVAEAYWRVAGLGGP